MHLIDDLLLDMRHDKSCGLAPIVYFENLHQWLEFSVSLSTVLWIGYRAQKIQEISRMTPVFLEFDQ